VLDRDEVPRTLFEFKAIYSFDPIQHENGDLMALERDISKDLKGMRRWNVESVQYYGILLATHPLRAAGDLSPKIIKYQRQVAKSLQSFGADGVKERCVESVEKFLKGRGRGFDGHHLTRGDTYFGVDVEIL